MHVLSLLLLSSGLPPFPIVVFFHIRVSDICLHVSSMALDCELCCRDYSSRLLAAEVVSLSLLGSHMMARQSTRAVEGWKWMRWRPLCDAKTEKVPGQKGKSKEESNCQLASIQCESKSRCEGTHIWIYPPASLAQLQRQQLNCVNTVTSCLGEFQTSWPMSSGSDLVKLPKSTLTFLIANPGHVFFKRQTTSSRGFRNLLYSDSKDVHGVLPYGPIQFLQIR